MKESRETAWGGLDEGDEVLDRDLRLGPQHGGVPVDPGGEVHP
jgi:hypothetical protein